MQPDDYEALHEVYSQPEVIRGTLQLPFPSIEVWRQRAAVTSEGSYNLVAVVDDEVVGSLGLWVQRNPRRVHVGGVGMAVHDAWQGRGAGSALLGAALELADRWLNLVRIELEVFTDNERAIHLYRSAGFEVEGTLTAYAFRDGALADCYAMARVRSDAS